MTPFRLLTAAAVCLFLSCQTAKPPDYPSQLKKIFEDRVSKLDSAVVVDSFRMLRMEPLTARLGLTIEDSFYHVSYNKVMAQLTAAKSSGRTDSIAFYQEELNYMKGQVDSFSRAIAAADTADLKMGKLVSGYYELKKNGKTHPDTAYFFFDKNMRLMSPEIVDSLVSRSIQFLR